MNTAILRTLLTAGITAGLIALPTASMATIITFDGLGGTNVAGNTGTHAAWTNFSGGGSTDQSGFTITATAGSQYIVNADSSFYNNGSDASTWAYNGDDYWQLFTASGATTTTTIEKIGGGAFSFNSIDMVHWYDHGSPADKNSVVTFVGQIAGGGTVNQIINVNDGIGHNASTQIGTDL